jgi:hypothetical protein
MGNSQVFAATAGVLRIAASVGFGRNFLDFFAVLRDEYAACGIALKRSEQVIVGNVAASPVFWIACSGNHAARALPISSDPCVQLCGTHGREIGDLSDAHCISDRCLRRGH